jgi:pilus assembly protein Flp/PilA
MMVAVGARLRAFVSEDEGATAIEYGLIAALVAVGCIAAFGVFGAGLMNLFNGVEDNTSDVLENAI